MLTSAIPPADSFDNSLAALAQTALGERDVQVTAFQMALVAASIANDGLLMQPHLVARVFDADSTLESEFEPTLYSQPLGAGTATVLQQMMERVITQGTGTNAQIPGVRVAGKTGTAHGGAGPPHAWLIGFAPVENPTIAIAVVVCLRRERRRERHRRLCGRADRTRGYRGMAQASNSKPMSLRRPPSLPCLANPHH